MRRKIFLKLTLLVLPLILFSTALTRYAAAAEQGTLTIADRSYQNGTLSFTAALSGITPEGQLAATVFTENNVFKNCTFYPAKDSVKVQVSAGSTDTVKIAWLDDSQRFLAPPDILRMDQSGTRGSEHFTADLQKLISSFNPSGGAEAVGENDPYYLQRLIVKCDILPNLTDYQAAVLTGPDNLYILSFATPAQAKKCAEYIRSQPTVKYVAPDRTLIIDSETAGESAAYLQDSGSHHSWGVKATGIGAYAEDLRQRSLNRQIVVAVLDSGIEADHAFLSGRLLSATNLSLENNTEDLLGHGTHVAGIIADCTQGLDVKILPIKVMNRFGSFTTSSLIGGIYEAASKGANVINLSLSAPSTEEYQPIEDAVRYAVSKNITVVAAAGNQGGDTSKRTPACLEDCITVTAVKQNETRFEPSNYGDAVDLTAPGVSINSSVPGGNYGDMSGTSMAAPHVSAAAALLLYDMGTNQTPTQISKSLCGSTRLLSGQTGWTQEYGYGMLDLTPFIRKTAGAYAILYSDGELVFQTTNTPTAGRKVTEVYPVQTSVGGSSEYAAWYERRETIKKVTFADRIQPVSTAFWFYGCGSLATVNGLDKLDTSKVTDMAQMFADCADLTELDLANFNTGCVTNMTGLFLGCTKLKTIYASDKFTTETVTSSRDMFKYCTSLVGGRGTRYDSGHTDKEYARIDGGASAPGYFTDPNAPTAYTVTWSTIEGCTIRVLRESDKSEYLSSGDTVYQGDRLRISYEAQEGYRITEKGLENITVEGDVTESSIWAVATVMSYTCTIQHESEDGAQLGSVSITRPFRTKETYTPPDYAGYKTPEAKEIEWTKDQTVTFTYARNSYAYTVQYVSEHGAQLGSITLTRPFGTKETHTPPSYAGYSAPAAREITWDTAGAKTITFTYSVSSVGYTNVSGRTCDNPLITFGAEIQYRNRTADSVQIRVVWTDTIASYGFDAYSQNLNVSINGIGAGPVTVASFNLWGSSASYERSSTGETDWITVPLGVQSASVSVSVYHYQANYYGVDMVAYNVTPYTGTWTVPVPVY